METSVTLARLISSQFHINQPDDSAVPDQTLIDRAFWVQAIIAAATVLAGILTLCLVKRKGSFRFLSINIILIIVCEALDLSQILAKHYDAY